MTHLKRTCCWERLKGGGEGDDRGWYGWMASLTQWTWVWVNSRSWWWTGRPDVLGFMGSQRVGHDSATELTELIWSCHFFTLLMWKITLIYYWRKNSLWYLEDDVIKERWRPVDTGVWPGESEAPMPSPILGIYVSSTVPTGRVVFKHSALRKAMCCIYSLKNKK